MLLDSLKWLLSTHGLYSTIIHAQLRPSLEWCFHFNVCLRIKDWHRLIKTNLRNNIDWVVDTHGDMGHRWGVESTWTWTRVNTNTKISIISLCHGIAFRVNLRLLNSEIFSVLSGALDRHERKYYELRRSPDEFNERYMRKHAAGESRNPKAKS